MCIRLILRQLNLHPLHHPAAAAAHHQNDELDVYNREKGQQLYSPLGLVYVYKRRDKTDNSKAELGCDERAVSLSGQGRMHHPALYPNNWQSNARGPGHSQQQSTAVATHNRKVEQLYITSDSCASCCAHGWASISFWFGYITAHGKENVKIEKWKVKESLRYALLFLRLFRVKFHQLFLFFFLFPNATLSLGYVNYLRI